MGKTDKKYKIFVKFDDGDKDEWMHDFDDFWTEADVHYEVNNMVECEGIEKSMISVEEV